jgi:hypothetical protein
VWIPLVTEEEEEEEEEEKKKTCKAPAKFL